MSSAGMRSVLMMFNRTLNKNNLLSKLDFDYGFRNLSPPPTRIDRLVGKWQRCSAGKLTRYFVVRPADNGTCIKWSAFEIREMRLTSFHSATPISILVRSSTNNEDEILPHAARPPFNAHPARHVDTSSWRLTWACDVTSRDIRKLLVASPALVERDFTRGFFAPVSRQSWKYFEYIVSDERVCQRERRDIFRAYILNRSLYRCQKSAKCPSITLNAWAGVKLCTHLRHTCHSYRISEWYCRELINVPCSLSLSCRSVVSSIAYIRIDMHRVRWMNRTEFVALFVHARIVVRARINAKISERSGPINPPKYNEGCEVRARCTSAISYAHITWCWKVT